mmetsp:Transcript_18093/g.31698  ORF Transcript_18093/g.31698 Transcript_18093/m.31698 type:complete len:204 (-) Transcript_18093:3234-3845(-)
MAGLTSMWQASRPRVSRAFGAVEAPATRATTTCVSPTTTPSTEKDMHSILSMPWALTSRRRARTAILLSTCLAVVSLCTELPCRWSVATVKWLGTRSAVPAALARSSCQRSRNTTTPAKTTAVTRQALQSASAPLWPSKTAAMSRLSRHATTPLRRQTMPCVSVQHLLRSCCHTRRCRSCMPNAAERVGWATHSARLVPFATL